ncbi:MAG: hypothetical protein RIE73_20265 [Coleofasciculus sp. C1-SOL-03]
MEYLHYRWRQGRGQRAEGRGQRAEGRRLQGKEEGCKAQGNNDCLSGHDIT